MGYDWEKIFEDKTNKELYDIVIGEKVLSKEAVKYAKKELENRNFDFDNMAANKAAWQISDLIEEEDYARLEIAGRRVKHIPLKILFLLISGIIIIYFIFNKILEYDFPIEYVGIFIVVTIFYILLNNFQAKRQQQAHNNRMEKIKELKEKLDSEKLLKKDSPIQKEIIRHKIKETKEITRFSYIFIVVITVLLLIYFLL